MDNKNNDIGNLIRLYRDAKHMSQAELAKRIGVSQRNVSYYESGEHVPPADILKKLAAIFGISVDVLVGVKKFGSTGDCYDYFYEEGTANWNIRLKAEERNLSYEEVMERTCIPKERFDRLWGGTVQPYAEELIRFSEVLDVSIDYLLDNSKHEKISAEEEIILRYYYENPSDVMELLGSFSSLSKKKRTILLGKCFELEENSDTSKSVAAEEEPMKEAK